MLLGANGTSRGRSEEPSVPGAPGLLSEQTLSLEQNGVAAPLTFPFSKRAPGPRAEVSSIRIALTPKAFLIKLEVKVVIVEDDLVKVHFEHL